MTPHQQFIEDMKKWAKVLQDAAPESKPNAHGLLPYQVEFLTNPKFAEWRKPALQRIHDRNDAVMRKLQDELDEKFKPK